MMIIMTIMIMTIEKMMGKFCTEKIFWCYGILYNHSCLFNQPCARIQKIDSKNNIT